MKVLEPTGSYTFSKIFELKLIAQDLAAEFGYTLTRKRLSLPQYQGELDRIRELQNRIEETLPYVNLSTETARR
jgi:NifB/MoaA-like Fe-S oxidoreductase